MSEPLCKISIVLYLGKPRNGTIEFLPSGVGDFTILYSPGVRFYICLVAQIRILLWHLNKHHGELFYLATARYLYSAIFGEINNHNYFPLVLKFSENWSI